MPRIPQVEKITETRALPTGPTAPLLSPVKMQNIPAPDQGAINAVGQAGINAAKGTQAIADALGSIAAKAKKKGDTIALMEAQRKLDQWENDNIYNPDSGALSRKGKDAMGVPNEYDAQWEASMADIWDGLANDEQRIAFEQMADSRRKTVQRTLYQHERVQMDQYAEQSSKAAVDSSVNRAALYYAYPEIVDSAIQQGKTAARMFSEMNGVPEEAIKNMELEIESKSRYGVLQRLADDDPSTALKYFDKFQNRMTVDDLMRSQKLMAPVRRKIKANDLAQNALSTYQPAATQDSAISFVMNTLEGGDKVHIDNDGGTVKYGINSKSNPGVDVEGMTEEQAKAYYKKHYWDKMDIDKMPADMRLVAFDAAVNHGADSHTKQMIEQAGGDARKLIEIRGQYYEELAKKDPEKYGPYLDGWKNRLANLTKQVDLMRGQVPSEYALNQYIDANSGDLDVAQDAKNMVKAQLDSFDKAKKQSEVQAANEAWEYVRSGMPVPSSVESRMNAKEAVAMRSRKDFDPETYETLRLQVLTGQAVDLSPFRWQLGNKYDELVKLQQDPTKVVNARKVDSVIKNAQGIILGKSTPKSRDDFEKVEMFRRAVDVEVEAYQKLNGKLAGPDEVEKITDRLLLEVDPSGWGNSGKRAFEMQPGEEFDYMGIPSDRKFIVDDTEISYDMVVEQVIQAVQDRGLPLNEDTLSKTYDKLVSSGAIVEKYK